MWSSCLSSLFGCILTSPVETLSLISLESTACSSAWVADTLLSTFDAFEGPLLSSFPPGCWGHALMDIQALNRKLACLTIDQLARVHFSICQHWSHSHPPIKHPNHLSFCSIAYNSLPSVEQIAQMVPWLVRLLPPFPPRSQSLPFWTANCSTWLTHLEMDSSEIRICYHSIKVRDSWIDSFSFSFIFTLILLNLPSICQLNQYFFYYYFEILITSNSSPSLEYSLHIYYYPICLYLLTINFSSYMTSLQSICTLYQIR